MEASFRAMTRELQSRFLLNIICDVSENCILVEPRADWKRIACEASTLRGGKFLTPGVGVCNTYGGEAFWLLPRSSYLDIIEAREVAQFITGEPHGWSVASNARACWKWAIPATDEKPCVKAVQRGNGIGYNHCLPGEYTESWMLDMTSCYWNLLNRLPTRKWEEAKGGVFYKVKETREEKARLKEVFSVLSHFKKMRNSVWGSCLGRTELGSYFFAGEQKKQYPYFGTHPTAALIVGRMAWELTLLASIHSNAYYAQTDAIICHKDESPKVWEQWGMSYKMEAWGDASIHRQHVYKIGEKQTLEYRARDTFREAKAIGEMPKELYLTRFL